MTAVAAVISLIFSNFPLKVLNILDIFLFPQYLCVRVEAGSDCLSSPAFVSLVEAGGAHWSVHLPTVIDASSSKIPTASNLTFTLFKGGSYSEMLEQPGKVILPCTLNLDKCNKRKKKAVEYQHSTGMSCANWWSLD